MKRKVGQKVDHERGDDHDSDRPGSADSRSATFGIRFGGSSLVVLIARLRRQLAAVSGRPVTDEQHPPPCSALIARLPDVSQMGRRPTTLPRTS
jgi:hypothetical protein